MTDKPRRRVRPLECASIHYTCDQIEDSIRRLFDAIDLYKEWKATSEADLQHYREADYLGGVKANMIRSAARIEKR